MRVATQGQAGSFHHQAAQQWYGDDVVIIPCATFSDTFRAYADRRADAIIVAVENTIYGTINETYRYIETCTAPITGEVTLTIEQMLITQPDTQLSDISEVYSHPVALSQCRQFLQEFLPHAASIEYFDTAGAVERVKQCGSRRIAAIASRAAAKLHHLPINKRSIQDSRDNLTRFLVLDPSHIVTDPNRATLVATAAHQPGGLLDILQVFATQQINIINLQSQPIVNQPWNYKFFITVDAAGPSLQRAVQLIRSAGRQITLLGQYRAAA